MSKRIKSGKGAVVVTRGDVEDMVGQLRTLAVHEQKVLADKNREVQRIEERCAPALEEIARERKQIATQVQLWAEAHPEEFAKRKSLELTHGIIGFRTGTPKLALLKRGGSWEGALECVKAFLPNFIRNKPEIDKEALLAQRDEEPVKWALPQCGLKVTQGESFFIEPHLEQVAEKVQEVARG